MKSLRLRFELLVVLGVSACNVTPVKTTGGVELPARGDCPRGIAVVSSDFTSTEIALLAPDGSVKSPAFLSSASTRATNLAAPLSGDVGVATARSRPGELVTVDRFGTDVLTFVDTRTAGVRAQLPVGTGFDANPQDYVELDEHHAFVPRLSENRTPGREPFDEGSDLLVVDPTEPAVVGSVPLPRREGFLPSPVGVLSMGGELLVTLIHARPDFSDMAESELVALSSRDPQQLRYRVTLEGLKNCGRAELSPKRAILAIACSSYLDCQGAAPEPETSGVILLDATSEPLQELRRFLAVELVKGPIQSSLEFASDRVVLFKTQTALGAAQDNRLFSLNIETGATELLATAGRAESGLGYGIAFGGMHCGAGCGDPCLASDSSRGELLKLRVDGDALSDDGEVRIDGAGLPPVGFTPFW